MLKLSGVEKLLAYPVKRVVKEHKLQLILTKALELLLTFLASPDTSLVREISKWIPSDSVMMTYQLQATAKT